MGQLHPRDHCRRDRPVLRELTQAAWTPQPNAARSSSFETHRIALTGLAYRMLGSRAEAEDVVQDAYLRWHAIDPT